METVSKATEIQQQVADILSAAFITFSVHHVGQTKRDDWDCDAWRVSFNGKRVYETDYFTGLGHRKAGKVKAPTAADVLYSLILDSSAGDQSFNDWCADYGYSNDSLSALNTYQACCKTSEELRKMFSPDVRKAVADAVQDY